jgi:RNA polymerase sigma-70 factor (ECF subfamily)
VDDLQLVAALRRRDERAFVALIDRFHPSLVRLALTYVHNRAVAEEVAQETWQGVLEGLDRFEGRAGLKTWIFRILTNRAKTRGQREGRAVPFSALAGPDEEAERPDVPAVEPDRFRAEEPWRDHWVSAPRPWEGAPEAHLLRKETRRVVEEAVATLPPGQRDVIVLRDVEGCSADEVCAIVGVSEANQRVLLHRARSRVRRALERYLEDA